VNIAIIVAFLVVINMLGIALCLYKLHMVNKHFFDIIAKFANVSEFHSKTVDDIKHILLKAYNIDEMPKPGTYQTKIKPTHFSETELYDLEKK
jgi:hypothetical protein